jgi:hypothetical protein
MARDEIEPPADGLGAIERLSQVASLVASLDRRIVELFASLGHISAASARLERLSEEGADLVADLRSRMDRLEAKLRVDVDEVKHLVLEKLEGIDLEGFGERMADVEKAIFNIERAVTRLDSLVGGVVDSVPDFITRRVRSRAGQPADDEPV